MAIKMPEKKEAGIGKLLGAGKAVLGVATGNPAMAISGASDVAGQDSPIGRAMAMKTQLASLAPAPEAPAPAAPAPGMGPSLGVSSSRMPELEAMKRRLGSYGN